MVVRINGKRKFGCCLLHASLPAWLTVQPEDGGDMFLQNVS
jgi:hypothetical protein